MKIHRSVIKNARNIVNNDFLVIDTETTGVKKDAEIVEIALLNNNGETVFHSLIKPSKPIPEEAIKIHRITNLMVQDAPSFADIAIPLLEILSNKTIVAHNANFDRKRLNYEFSRCNLDLNAKWECTMLMSSPKGQKWNRLGEAMQQLNIHLNGVGHRALFDAECCRQILIAISKKPIFWMF